MALDLKKVGKNLKVLRETLNVEPGGAIKGRKNTLSTQRTNKIEAGAEPTLTELEALAYAYGYTSAGLVRNASKGA